VGFNGMKVGLLGEGEKVMGKGVSYEGQRRTCLISLLLLIGLRDPVVLCL
jgi:hypothetical protein